MSSPTASGAVRCDCGKPARRRWCSDKCQRFFGFREWYGRVRGRQLAKMKAYYWANRERLLKQKAAWQIANREAINSRAAAYRQANRASLNAKARARSKRPEVKEKVKAWQLQNASQRRAWREAYKAKLTPAERRNLRRRYGRTAAQRRLEKDLALLSLVLTSKN